MNDDLLNQGDKKKVCDLTILEYKKLWIECYDDLLNQGDKKKVEEMEQHKLDTSMEEYKKLTEKFPNNKENL